MRGGRGRGARNKLSPSVLQTIQQYRRDPQPSTNSRTPTAATTPAPSHSDSSMQHSQQASGQHHDTQQPQQSQQQQQHANAVPSGPVGTSHATSAVMPPGFEMLLHFCIVAVGCLAHSRQFQVVENAKY